MVLPSRAVPPVTKFAQRCVPEHKGTTDGRGSLPLVPPVLHVDFDALLLLEQSLLSDSPIFIYRLINDDVKCNLTVSFSTMAVNLNFSLFDRFVVSTRDDCGRDRKLGWGDRRAAREYQDLGGLLDSMQARP